MPSAGASDSQAEAEPSSLLVQHAAHAMHLFLGLGWKARGPLGMGASALAVAPLQQLPTVAFPASGGALLLCS